MILESVKVFETGNYPQGSFPIDAVKDIFSNTDKVSAQFAHTSKINKAGKDVLDLGEFSNFAIGEDGVVTADIEFNEKGDQYYEDGTINGCSVEIANGVVSAVAILPVGVTPAISGAEFEESGSITFGGEFEANWKDELIAETQAVKEEVKVEVEEEVKTPKKTKAKAKKDVVEEVVETEEAKEEFQIDEPTADGTVEDKATKNKMSLKEIGEYLNQIDMSTELAEFKNLQDIVWKLGDNKYAIEQLMADGYDVNKTPNEFEAMTNVEIRESIRKEFESKDAGAKMYDKLVANGQMTKALEEKGLTKEFMSMVESKKGDVLEFANDSFDFEIISTLLEALPKHTQESKLKETEFEKIDANTKRASTLEMIKLINGKRG